MTTKPQQPIPDDEIDLRRAGGKILGLLNLPFRLWLANKLITLLFVALGCATALYLRYFVDPVYTSSFVLRPNDKTEKFHLKMLGDISSLLKQKDYEGLKRELKLDQNVLAAIDKLDAVNTSYAKGRNDSINATEVIIRLKDNRYFITVQNAVINYLEGSEHFQKIRQLQITQVKTALEEINSELEMVDSLKKLQLSSYDKTKITEGNALALKDMLNPTATYTLAEHLFNKKLDLQARQSYLDNFQLVKKIVEVNKSSWPPRLLVLSVVFIPAFLLLALVFILLRDFSKSRL